jgi:hypothetical protein
MTYFLGWGISTINFEYFRNFCEAHFMKETGHALAHPDYAGDHYLCDPGNSRSSLAGICIMAGWLQRNGCFNDVSIGLVTVLFVFAINMAGDEALAIRKLIPRPLAWLLMAAAAALLGWMIIPGLPAIGIDKSPLDFAEVLWRDRQLDTLLQVLLIFAGVLGVIGLLAEGKPKPSKEN